MADERVRRRVAFEAARLIFGREESELFRARLRAARQILSGDVKPWDLPTNREIRQELESLARTHEDRRRHEDVRRIRIEALRLMRVLNGFQPRLVGGALEGWVRNSNTDLHVYSDNIADVAVALDREAIPFDIARQRRRVEDGNRVIAEIYAGDPTAIRLIVHPAAWAGRPMRSPVTGRVIEGGGISEVEELVARDDAETPTSPAALRRFCHADRFEVFEGLLLPLEKVKQDPRRHPEGDVLYHSLQVFELARAELPYDEEFLLAALLHDVGKAIDLKDHVAAGLEALEGWITPRTAWLIEHHVEALALREGTLGARSRRRLQSSEDFEELALLAECDAAGRVVGAVVADVEETLAYLRELADMCGE